ncbi:MAG: glycosyltransferase family 39 protein, partial [Candidatus Odinarchaeota archaeon]
IFAYLIAKKEFNSEITARISLLILSVYPNHIAYCSLLSSEVLFLFLITCGTFFILEIKDHFIFAPLSGIAFGFACLVKIQAILLPILVFTVKFFKVEKRKIQMDNFYRFVTLYTALVMTILPWLIRNFIAFGRLVFSTNGGINLYIGNNPESTGTWMAIPPELANIADEITRDAVARDLAINYIFTHPVETVLRIPVKLFYALLDFDGFSWNEDSIAFLTSEAHVLFLLLKIISELFYVSCLCLFVLFFIHQFKNGELRKIPKLGSGFIIYFLLITVGFFGIQRFHFAIIPWIVLYGSNFLEKLIHKNSESQEAPSITEREEKNSIHLE